MYRYETHLHTFPVSRCAKASVRESLECYKQLGYDGVFITNHFIDNNRDIYQGKTYAEQLAIYFSDYKEALKLSGALGIKVFCGLEISYGGSDFLIYGLDEEWFLQHPELMEMRASDSLTLMQSHGALIIHAHPFREARYIDHIHLFPRHVHGVEVINASDPMAQNEIAKFYADHYHLIPFGGSDNHSAARQTKLAGVCFETPIRDEADFAEKVKSGQANIFTLTNEQP